MTEPQEMKTADATLPPLSTRLRELAGLFLKLGAISFGGPAAHIALIEGEIVRKRQWVTRQQFLDMLGAANLIPGPTSTEMAINVGFVRAGWAGLCVAGASFILPAALITGAFAWAYVRFGTRTQAVSVLGGIKAAVIAVIAIAIWRLGKTAVKDVGLAGLGIISLAAFFLGVNPIAILFGGGLLGMLALTDCNVSRLRCSAFFAADPAKRFCPTRRRNVGSLVAFVGNGGSGVRRNRRHCRVALHRHDRPIFSESGSRALWWRIRAAGFPGAGISAAACVADAATIARRGGDRTVHAWTGTLDRNIYRIYFGRRAGSGGGDGGNFSTFVFLCRAAGAGALPAAAIPVDGGVSGFRKCLRRGLDGWRYVPAGRRCFTGMAGLGDRNLIVSRVAAMESESGVGGAGERDCRAFVGGLPLTVVVFESNLLPIREEKP